MKTLTTLITIAMLATSSIAFAQPPGMTPGDGQQAGMRASAKNVAIAAGIITAAGAIAGFFYNTNNRRPTISIQHTQ